MATRASLARHKGKFPPEIAEYFDSTWEKRELWSLDLPRHMLRVSDLRWHLDYPFWSMQPPGPVFDLMPRTVLANPRKHSRHWSRIAAADLSFPVDLSEFGGRLVILDGLHRLAKAAHSEATELQARLVPRKYLRVAA